MKFLLIALDGQADLAVHVAASQVRMRYDVDLQIAFHVASELNRPEAVEKLRADAADADVVFAVHQFADEQVSLIRSLLHEYGARYQAVICIMSAPSLVRETRLGRFVLSRPTEEETPWYSPLRMMRAVKGAFASHDASAEESSESKGAGVPGRTMLTMLKNAGKIMKYIPGKAQDIHAYMQIIQFWLNCSGENLENLFLFLLTRYTDQYRGKFSPKDPVEYPDVGLFHPKFNQVVESLKEYQACVKPNPNAGTVGVLMLRSYLLSGNRAHYEGFISELEKRGLNVIPAYAFGLDARPAIERYFLHHGRSTVDAVVSLTGFSLVGGPAYNDADAAVKLLKKLDVPYYCAPSLEFQTFEEWEKDQQGLNRLQATLMIAIPELDGTSDPIIFAGKTNASRLLSPIECRVERLAGRIERRVALRRMALSRRKISVVIFNFPPSQGNTGTAAYLDVFVSLHRFLKKMRSDGYRVENLPETVDELREQITQGNAAQYGQPANVCDYLPARYYEEYTPEYREIERAWGPSPGDKNVNGQDFLIMGREYGNVGVFVQPGFGFEDDPMRLLFSTDATPNHGFAAFYSYLKFVWKADSFLHFGTHGALEFMPGKQVGLSCKCWPDRLVGDIPNIYAYCANNPSEGLIAKRRGYATLVSYLSPPIEAAGLYKEFVALKETMDGYRNDLERSASYVPAIVEKAKLLKLLAEEFPEAEFTSETYQKVYRDLLELEYSLIPTGLHLMGDGADEHEVIETLRIISEFPQPERKLDSLTARVKRFLADENGSASAAPGVASEASLADFSQAIEAERFAKECVAAAISEMYAKESARAGAKRLAKACHVSHAEFDAHFEFLFDIQEKLRVNNELEALLRALDGRFIEPVAGGDLVRDPGVLPTGRNLHALDPYRMPTYVAFREAQASVATLLERFWRERGELPETVALVLWGTDNLKSGGVGVAQALWLLGARAVADEMGRINGVELTPLEVLGRPRIDIVLTLSGIFRDLLPQQMRLLDSAIRKAAVADEPESMNFVRAHVREQMREGVPFDEAAQRIFSNAPGSYGANVNHLIDSSTWEDESEIAQTFLSRKGFAYIENGDFVESRSSYERVLGTVTLTFQNIDSTEMNITDIDHYFEYLGGVTSAVKQIRGGEPTVMLSDATGTETKIRTLDETVRLEARTKLLNPKWYEGMLKHGYSGVQQIEQHVSNTFGWSATCQAVDSWVYDGVAQTYVLDEAMRSRLQQMNPTSLTKLTRRLLEANGRGFWQADEQMLEQLREAYAQMEDALEEVGSVR